MTIYRCPRCQRTFTSMGGPGNRDFEHQCNSGNNTTDNIDVFKLANQTNWKYQGVENSLSTKARIEGEDFEGVTKRGLRKTSYTQEQNYEFVELNDQDGAV